MKQITKFLTMFSSVLLLQLVCKTAIAACGEVIAIDTHDSTKTRYALQRPSALPASEKPIALLLLVGGHGFINLDDEGCPQDLKGNSLIRSLPLFHQRGFITALVDSPSDHQGEEGLGGFRIDEEHAQDIGAIARDIQSRTQATVWIIGTSRGTISAANAASRLKEPLLPEGVILTSAVTQGEYGKKLWVAHSVFDFSLEKIQIPFLIVGHEKDKCVRTPPGKMKTVLEKVGSHNRQLVTVTGGSGDGSGGLKACKGKTAHGFIGQEEEVVEGITRFIRSGKY